MAGPKLEFFRFATYVFFPILIMAHYGDPEWYNRHIYPLRDAFVQPEKAEVKLSENEDELKKQLAELRDERLAKKAKREAAALQQASPQEEQRWYTKMQHNAGNNQSEQLAKLIAAANAGQLTADQLQQLRQFLQANNNPAAQQIQIPPQAQPQQQQQQQIPQQPNLTAQKQPQQVSVPQQIQQLQQNANITNPQLVRSPAPYQQPGQQQQGGQQGQGGQQQQNDPRVIIKQMNTRINNIDQLLQRTDLSQDDRQRLQDESTSNKKALTNFIAQVKAAATHQQATQAAQQAAAAAAAQLPSTNVNQAGNVNDLQAAQHRAMAQKAQLLQQTQMQAQAQQQAQQQQQQILQQQLQNRINLQGTPQNLTLPPQAGGHSNGSNNVPQQFASGSLPAPNAANTASPAMSASSPPSNEQSQNIGSTSGMGTRAKKQQQQNQQAANNSQAGQQQAGSRSTPTGSASATNSQAQTPANTQVGSGVQTSGATQPPSNASAASAATSSSTGNAFPIPDQINMPPYKAEPFPSARPTLSSGLAASAVLTTPAITKPPIANLPSRPGSAAGLSSSTSAAAGANPAPQASTSSAAIASAPNIGRPGPIATKSAEGRPYNKRKLQELVASIAPDQVLDAQVEDLLLEVADEFVDSITRFACRLAKHRRSDRLECKDLNLVLEKTYNMQIPGFGNDEVRQATTTTTTKRTNLVGYQSRLAAVKEAKANR